ncbi:MAG: dihydroorotate dehydrogenase [Oscillospiraceae bacterium]|nr:dihydroorotate dehydrogenase [Oscillospiraceae bacterium]
MSAQRDLSVQIGSLHMKNPVMPAAGTYDYFSHNAGLFPMERLGAIMIKSVHRHPRPGNPPPRTAEVYGGMINAIGIPSVGMEAFMEREIGRFASLNVPVVLSISGSRPCEYAECLQILDNDPRIGAVEMNLACPNVDSGLPFSSDTETLHRTVAACRKQTRLPLIAKLNPSVPEIGPYAAAAEEAGADALTLSNTFRAMKIDLQRQKPILGNRFGGLSGPAIKAINLFLVWSACQRVKIPVIACGGICSGEDAVEYLLAGATAVQVGSYNFVNPNAMPEIIDGIEAYLAEKRYTAVKEIIGLAQNNP